MNARENDFFLTDKGYKITLFASGFFFNILLKLAFIVASFVVVAVVITDCCQIRLIVNIRFLGKLLGLNKITKLSNILFTEYRFE